MESFFLSLKTERIGKKVYRTRDDARADVFDYIERVVYVFPRQACRSHEGLRQDPTRSAQDKPCYQLIM